ncbi:hypothetical protein B0H19DRAFT_1077211 [Mycena capillaripes]|nr:hypothetical protein B0H19DRAFT_1077211 [Mycena capillaripes]
MYIRSSSIYVAGLIGPSVDAYGVPRDRGVGLGRDPTRVLLVSARTGAPWSAYCVQSCIQPPFIGFPGITSPIAGLVVGPGSLRATVYQIPSIATTFTRGATGGGVTAPSSRRDTYRLYVRHHAKPLARFLSRAVDAVSKFGGFGVRARLRARLLLGPDPGIMGYSYAPYPEQAGQQQRR